MNLHELLGVVGSLSDAFRPIRLRLPSKQAELGEALLVMRVTGTETLCGGLEYRLFCVSTRAGLPIEEFIALPIEVQFVTDQGALRAVCGFVDSAAAGPCDGGFSTYQLVVRDALTIMEKRTSTRVFLGLNEVEITNIMISEWRQSNAVLASAFNVESFSLSGSYPARKFTMQSNESDAAFLRRLWKRRGIAWFVRPGQPPGDEGTDSDTPQHTLVLFDDASTLAENAAGSVRYHRSGGTEARDCITGWSAVQTLKPGVVTRQSWDYKQARMMNSDIASAIDQGSSGQQFAASLDDYMVDAPHAGDDDDDYYALGKLRMQRHEYQAQCFYGEGDVRDLCVGQWNSVTGHPDIDKLPASEHDFVITELHVDAENNLPADLDEKVRRLFAASRWDDAIGIGARLARPASETGTRYTNRFTCVRRGTPIVPAFDPRVDLPPMHPMTAIVVCGPGLETQTNNLGCVKIRFPGCRVDDHTHADGAGASGSDRDSAWVRVATPWASVNYGMSVSHRAGDEVVVQFLGGDPDRPVVTGAVHGAETPPTSFSHTGTLPGNLYVTGIKSKEITGLRYNQLRLDDSPGQISAQLASEHGHSELNLGYLTHPRNDGRASARGEGADLRTDNAVSVRGAQGVLISADARQGAKDNQLDRDEMIGLNDVLQSIHKTLSELAGTHFAGNADGAPLAQLIEHIRQWEKGSNTEGSKPDPAGRKPIVAVSAPAGLALSSQDNVALCAQTNIDVLSAGNTQLTAGGKILVRSEDEIGLFAHKNGMQITAASGKVDVQAHDGDIALGAAKELHVYSLKSILIEAPEVVIRSEGVQWVFGKGQVVASSSGALKVEASDFKFVAGGGGNPVLPDMPHSTLQTDERMAFSGRGGQAREKIPYEARDAGGAVLDAGDSGADGATKAVVTDNVIKALRVHIKT
ncbi:hypothetical protein RugamoR57_57300 [Duganella caerulea]|uniref:type VI secretion system Vgr family protein n=1 Tax=Duganella caerulea TaxID=2885762 RepID=UPI0030EAA644